LEIAQLQVQKTWLVQDIIQLQSQKMQLERDLLQLGLAQQEQLLLVQQYPQHTGSFLSALPQPMNLLGEDSDSDSAWLVVRCAYGVRI
jgi:hypothetical protein